jgi:DUF971 family protein
MTVVRAPEAINYSQSRRILTISFPESDPVELSAELLRVLSPSAEVQGHGPGQKVLQTGKRGVSITDMQPIGHYAVQLSFDDGHSSGLYTWAYLAQLAENKDTLWADYLMKLARAGESRDPDTNIVKILG